MIDLQLVPFGDDFSTFLSNAKDSICICSPFITSSGTKYLAKDKIKTTIITKVTLSNIRSNALEAELLISLIRDGVKIYSIPNLHAKLYLIDERVALVTSSNLTGPGLQKNVELGLIVKDNEVISKLVSVWHDFLLKSTEVDELRILELLNNGKQLKFNKGIWKKQLDDTEADETSEDEVEALPVVGTPLFENLQTPPVDESIEADESGDVFIPLPQSISSIPKSLSQNNQLWNQAFINTFFSYSDGNLSNYLSVQTVESLIEISNPFRQYPNKLKILRRLIEVAGIREVGFFIQQLTSDISNENQLNNYNNAIHNRIKLFKESDKTQLREFLTPIIQGIELNINKPSKNKNFSKVFLDRIFNFFGERPSVIIDEQKEYKKNVPSFQEIKRFREINGNDSIFTFLRWSENIAEGLWDTNHSSVISLLKELRKIDKNKVLLKKMKLNFEKFKIRQDRVANRKVENLRQSLISISNYVTDEIFLEEIFKSIGELSSIENVNTGRLVSIEGKSNKIHNPIFTKEEKKNIDWLNTYRMLRNEISKF